MSALRAETRDALRQQRVATIDVTVCTIPTDSPEADGTLQWDRTTVVIVELATTDGVTGLGYAYGHDAMAAIIRSELAEALRGKSLADIGSCWEAMRAGIRNLGRPGIASMAIAACDIALWDGRARAAGEPLHHHLGAIRATVPVYGSGGFTSYDESTLVRQLQGWVEQGIPRVKMKIGRDCGRSWREDLQRIAAVRDAIGDDAELLVDANGAYDRTTALHVGTVCAREHGVTWFEEPVSSDDLEGLAALRRQLPLDVSAGEYGYDLPYFRRMVESGAVDVLQADAGRCAGISEWLRAAALAEAMQTPFSAHCGPSLHAHAACVPRNLRHIEYFHDHARIESMLFEGALQPVDGELRPDPERPGNGLSLRRDAVERYRTG